MKLATIIFDENTDYAAVVIKLKFRMAELVAIACSCGCDDPTEDKAIFIAHKYLKTAEFNVVVPDTVRYQDNVQAAYYELKTLDC